MGPTATNTGPGAVAVDNSSFGGPDAAQAAAANAAIAASSAPLVTTSAASRTNTASNVATLNTAVGNAAAGNATLNGQTVSGAPGGPVNNGPGAQSNTPPGTTTPAPAPVSTTPAPVSTTPAAATYTPPAGSTTTTLPSGATAYYNPTNDTMTDANGNPLTYSEAVGAWIDPSTGAPPVATSSSSSTDGTDDGSLSDSDIASAVSGLPASMQALATSNLEQLQQEQAQAKTTLAQAQATLANDPVATAAISAISAKYDVLIQAMQLKNKQVLGKASSTVGAFGGLGVMSQSFMSDEMDAASSRIANLVSEQQTAMLTAQAAYGKEDLAAFNTAMDAYNKTITDMNTALNDLNNATDKQVTEVQNQQKIDNSAANAQVANDLKNAKGVADSVAAKLTAAGVTDLSSYDYTDLASQLGINDPEILASAVEAAGAAATKANLGNENTQSTITDRDLKTNYSINKPYSSTGTPKGGTDNQYTYTSADVTAAQNLLQNGGSGYAPAGSDGYSDPGAYIALMNSWINLGGTAAGFAKVFPVKKYVNPASYSKLPASIQPTAAATTIIQH